MAPAHAPPPAVFSDLQVLDLLELCGSQQSAGRCLGMHQSSVCRSVGRLREQLDLPQRRGWALCRHGSNDCLHLLRQAYRAHRLMRGRLRLAADLLHAPLLRGPIGIEPVPPRFRSAHDWARLIAAGLLDGAIVPCWSHPLPPAPERLLRWPGVCGLPLGALDLELVGDPAAAGRRVLLPARAAARDLHQRLAARGWRAEVQPQACQEPAQWLRRLRLRRLAVPLPPALLAPGWLERQGLQPLAEPPLVERLWLLLPEGDGAASPPAQELLAALRRRLGAAGADQPVGSEGIRRLASS